MDAADAVFYAMLKIMDLCPQAIYQDKTKALYKKTNDNWLVEVEHTHYDIDKKGSYTFWYKITDDPKKAEFGCRQGFNDLK